MFGADSDEGMLEAHDKGYREGFVDGRAANIAGYTRAPAAIFLAIAPWQFQSFYDDLKAEAIRLGVKP